MAEEEGRKERSVTTGVHERAGWSHAGKLRLPTPLSSVSRAQLLGGMEQSGLISWRTYPQYQVFNRGRNRRWAVAMV
jgi:hypothetical protein